MDDSLQRALLASRSLPSVPSVAARILELVREDCGLADLVPALSQDPALAARLVRYANSPAYSRVERIASLKPAVMQLGLDTTVIVALSFSLVGALRPSSDGALNYNQFWRRALLSAASGRFIARSFGIGRIEEAFLAALIQDIGMMALDRAGMGVYEGLDDRQSHHMTLRVLERARAGATHAEVGAWLLGSWHFPEDVCAAVAGSHDLAALTESGTEPSFEWCVAYSGVLADTILDADAERLMAALAWADRYAPRSGLWHDLVLEQMTEAVADVERLFDTNLAHNLPELMNASKILLTQRALELTARFK